METRSPAQAVNPARAAQAELAGERHRKRLEPKEKGQESYRLVGNKVVKVTKTASKTHTVYTCTRDEADKAGIKYTRD